MFHRTSPFLAKMRGLYGVTVAPLLLALFVGHNTFGTGSYISTIIESGMSTFWKGMTLFVGAWQLPRSSVLRMEQ